MGDVLNDLLFFSLFISVPGAGLFAHACGRNRRRNRIIGAFLVILVFVLLFAIVCNIGMTVLSHGG